MKTQEQDTMDARLAPPARSRGARWLTGLGAAIVVMALVAASVVVFAQRGHQPEAQHTPPAGQWIHVLSGYTFTAPVAATGEPAVLYVCATPETSSSRNTTTVLRSSDFGAHWQDIGSKAGIDGSCQVAVSPTNSNDIYVVGGPGTVSSAKPPTSVLKHSTDGGQTWSTVLPSLKGPDSQLTRIWYLQQLSIAGSHLFAVEWMPQKPIENSAPSLALPLARLVMSADGGRSWTTLDNKFASAMQGVRGYAVDLTNPSNIYDLVGTPWFPFRRPIVEPNDPLPQPFLVNGELYKTSDGGATWKLVLKQVSFNDTVSLASGKPDTVYVGGSVGPLPLVRQAPQSVYPFVMGSFHLRMSSDGGAHWREVPPLSQAASARTWFVSPDGQVYTYGGGPFYAQPGAGQVRATAIPGTAVPVPPVHIGASPVSGREPQTPLNLQLPATALPGGTPVDATVVAPPYSSPSAGEASAIQRYDPAANRWSELTQSPGSGILLTVTPAGNASGAVLWFGGSANNKGTLYRYIVS